MSHKINLIFKKTYAFRNYLLLIILTAIGISEATGLLRNCFALVSYNGVNVINSKSVSTI